VVFDSIRKQKPIKLYISSDGPRNAEESKKVSIVREIVGKIDWNCEVQFLSNEQNLGCRGAVEKAITWFFDCEEQGVILEDDCLPSDSFYRFCKEILIHYKNDQRIFGITGDNFQKGPRSNFSYYFSRYFFMWGWATWKSRWEKHLTVMENFDSILKDLESKKLLNDKFANDKLIKNAICAMNGGVDTWDFQWIFSAMVNNSLVVTPEVNLIKNIGFDQDSTHTKSDMIRYQVESKEMEFPINHPNYVLPDLEADEYLFNKILKWKSLYKKIISTNYYRFLQGKFQEYKRS
jgi:hypothetical protein